MYKRQASTKCFRDFVKYTQQQGLQVEVPAAGTMWPLGGATAVSYTHLEREHNVENWKEEKVNAPKKGLWQRLAALLSLIHI